MSCLIWACHQGLRVVIVPSNLVDSRIMTLHCKVLYSHTAFKFTSCHSAKYIFGAMVSFLPCGSPYMVWFLTLSETLYILFLCLKKNPSLPTTFFTSLVFLFGKQFYFEVDSSCHFSQEAFLEEWEDPSLCVDYLPQDIQWVIFFTSMPATLEGRNYVLDSWLFSFRNRG